MRLGFLLALALSASPATAEIQCIASGDHQVCADIAPPTPGMPLAPSALPVSTVPGAADEAIAEAYAMPVYSAATLIDATQTYAVSSNPYDAVSSDEGYASLCSFVIGEADSGC